MCVKKSCKIGDGGFGEQNLHAGTKVLKYILWQRLSAIALHEGRASNSCNAAIVCLLKIYPLSVISLTSINVSTLRHPRPANAERARSIFVATACLHPDGGVEAKRRGSEATP